MPAPSSSARHRPVDGPGAQAPANAGRADADETLKPEGAADGGRRQEDGAVDELLDVAVGALGGARRDGQHAMARAVAESLRSGEHLLVQAGTGTGKSLGYLVPAVRHAVHTDERVVVSTATLALQRQVLTRDLPLVADALAPHLPRRPDVALLKGWHNYLCLHKVDGGYPADDQGSLFDLPEKAGAAEHPSAGASGPGALGQQVLRLREWAEQTDSGDRDDLVPGVSDRAWRQVSVTSLECLGSACPKLDECFPERARGLAREADVVVTNHAMLGIAASGSPNVLPEHQVLVVDEAHELADRVTTQATVELSLPVVQHAARVARRNGAPSTDLEAAGEALAAVLVPLREGRFPNGLPTEVHDAVAAVRDAARTLLSLLRPEPGSPGGAAPADGGRKVAQSAVLTLFETAERMTAEPDDAARTVMWCARGEDRSGAVTTRLHAAPLAVNGLIRTQLFAGRTAVLTSATLALGGSFDPMARSVGLEQRPDLEPEGPTSVPGADPAPGPAPAGPVRWRGLDVGSPFDYPRQGICYVARRLPPPGREPATDAQLDEIEVLLRASGGAALGLFSSRRAAAAAAEAMRERLDVPVLLQGDDQLPTLVAQFAADEPTCLFGSLALWQGVDVPGRACRLVLIDRIPFPRPDDPVRSARADVVARTGGNGFMAVSATHAALLLAQGAGRLVRGPLDKGVVAVLDPRLATARYGEFLARSMPPFWRTTDRDVAVAALARLRDA